MVNGISEIDLEEWETEIHHAEENRLQDRSLMDIIGAKQHNRDRAAVSLSMNSGPIGSSVTDWIRTAIDIEEQQ